MVPLPLRPLDSLFLCVTHSPNNLASGTSFGMAFVKDYAARADGNTQIFVKYMNKSSCINYCVSRFKYWLQNDDQKIVGLDVENTWTRGPTQMAVVVQLCVDIYVLVYHISVADEHYGLLAAFLLDKEYTFVGLDINNDRKKLKRVGMVV
ncbi:hypothetical protein D1007_16432 [Hordeum vulgare]|nr:hypothetical protein D1007_16432 [Hordeum vulgare]